MIFLEEEFNSRITKVKDSMNKKGIEILLTTDPSNMNYLTGYDGWSFYVPQGVIVSIDEEQPYWFGRKQDSNGARITTHLNEENIFGYPENLIQSPPLHPSPTWPGGVPRPWPVRRSASAQGWRSSSGRSAREFSSEKEVQGSPIRPVPWLRWRSSWWLQRSIGILCIWRSHAQALFVRIAPRRTFKATSPPSASPVSSQAQIGRSGF